MTGYEIDQDDLAAVSFDEVVADDVFLGVIAALHQHGRAHLADQFERGVFLEHHDEIDGFRYYGGYASLFIMLPADDRVGRVFPPFQGNGGGPSGGPILRLNGKDIDIFFHPTALRPGSILVRGDNVSFAGYVAPTLGSRLARSSCTSARCPGSTGSGGGTRTGLG